MTILQRLIYSTGASDGGGRGANRSFERNKHHSTDFCFYTSTHFDGSPTSTILATSSRNTNNASHYQVQKLLASRELDGPLCIHRKGFFDHLKPRAFATSTLRVVTQQGTLVMANFMTDQLQGDLERNQLVDEGKLSQVEADEQAEEWEKHEWEKRWQAFPKKFMIAFAKYHVITLVMRLYEAIAAQIYDKVTLDKLTMDTFYASKKITADSDMSLTGAKKSTGANSVGSSGQKVEIASAMFHTSMWANCIAFLSDYSVHQVILCYGYYVYIQGRRSRLKLEQGTAKHQADEEDNAIVDHGAIFTSFVKKSTRLLFSRGVGLVFCSVGSAVGTVVYPGWGTLLFANMGEGAAGVILEESSNTEN